MTVDPVTLRPCPECGGEVTGSCAVPYCVRCGYAPPMTPMDGIGNVLVSARSEIEELREALGYYAETFCELGRHHECCGKLSEEECSGCKARALTRIAQPENRGGGE